MGEAALRLAREEHSWDAVAEATERLYRRLLEDVVVKAVEIAFWVSVGLIVYTHAGYPLLLAGLARLRRRPLWRMAELPRVSLVIAAHDEREVIEERVRNALALDYPPDRLEVIVASDGSTDGTAELARAAAGGDPRVRVLDLERRGKVRAQDAAVDAAHR